MNIYCNNCGKKGHISRKCNNPITSIGIICFNTTLDKHLMIRRKHTMSYISFIRGIYNLVDIKYLKKLLNFMTNDEKKNILERDFDYLWQELWMKENYFSKNFEKLKNKFNKIKDGIEIESCNYNIKSLIQETENKWEEQEWGFPKGKKKNGESNLTCAKREFFEETNIPDNTYTILNVQPIIEIFTGLNGLKYKYIYYVAKINNDITVNIKNNFQKMEISNIQWLTLEECLKKIRPYSKERIHIIKDLQNKLVF